MGKTINKEQTAFLKDVFYPSIDGDRESVHKILGADPTKVIDICTTLYNFIGNLTWDDPLNSSDKLFLELSNKIYFNPRTNTWYSLSAKDIAEALAYICAKMHIAWDDTQHTVQELDYFKKSIFGKALADFGCFSTMSDVELEEPSKEEPAPQPAPQPQPAQQSTSSTQSSSSTSSTYNSSLTRTNCPSVDAQNKVNLYGFVYWIKGDFYPVGGKAPRTNARVHISPKWQNKAYVKFTSGQGYEDCVLYWPTRSDAENFLAKIDAYKDSKVQRLYVQHCSAKANGYLLVHTNYGDAYILAQKLNEELEETLTEEINVNESVDYKEELKLACEALKSFCGD